MSLRLSYAQAIILQAASEVDHLPVEARKQINVAHGVWRSLVIRGFMRPVRGGWEITEEGRALVTRRTYHSLVKRRTSMRRTMEGKLPRYAVARTAAGWAIIDRHISKIRMHNDVKETHPYREAARVRCHELNLAEHGPEESTTQPAAE